MTKVVWTRDAVDDLELILDFIEQRSRQGAATVAAGVRRTLQDIEAFPRAARQDQGNGLL